MTYSPASIETQLRQATELLSASSDSARADSRILLCAVLDRPASYLMTWPERELTPQQQAQYRDWLNRRSQGEPVAHILGRRAFWSLMLRVNASTLIPRPDTELLVEQALILGDSLGERAGDSLCPAQHKQPCRVVDLGTGTGAIALAIAAERPNWQVSAVEYQPEAAALARQNAAENGLARVVIHQGSWFEPLAGQRFELIVSNPPYIDAADPHLAEGDVRFEPASALVAEEQGLADLRYLINQAPDYLEPGGWLLLEHGWQQGAAVRALFSAAGYQSVETRQDLGANDRVTLGCWMG